MDKELLLVEVRYAERLCQRTARLYRHLQTVSVFLSVLGGSGVISAVSGAVPAWMPIAGGVLLTVFGAVNLAVRPAEKAAANEGDVKRYAQLRSAAPGMDAAQLHAALEKARETDVTEIEALRPVAYNDVVREIGRDDEVMPLSLQQRIAAAFA